MSEKPIIFGPESVQGILEQRKSQTRRVADQFHSIDNNYGDVEESEKYPGEFFQCKNGEACESIVAPYQVGDILWVKEPWIAVHHGSYEAVDRDVPIYMLRDRLILYAADPVHGYHTVWGHYEKKWRNPLFMPRWASRISIRITQVRVELVQEISAGDALAEGVHPEFVAGLEIDIDGYLRKTGEEKAIAEYQRVWDKINGKKHPFTSNPWVWCYTFEGITL